jgi:hypothetical protein
MESERLDRREVAMKGGVDPKSQFDAAEPPEIKMPVSPTIPSPTGSNRGRLLVLLPALIFLIHSFLFADWIVDDAGISFAYARNLAAGYGLVPQSGSAPIEAYSNFLWLILCVPFFALGIFDPLVIPKLLSLLFVVASFFIIYQICRGIIEESVFVPIVVLSLTASNTSFVVWTSSGLENPLYVFLLCLLMFLSLRAALTGNACGADGALAGIIAGLVSLTRPEGILFWVAYPAVLVAFTEGSRSRQGQKRRTIVTYCLASGFVLGGYMLFRTAYFHEWAAMAYYVKPVKLRQSLADVIMLQVPAYANFQTLMTAALGPLGNIVAVVICGISLHLANVGKWRYRLGVIGIFTLIAALAFMLMPPDWMGEYRFATFFIPCFYVYAVIIAYDFARSLKSRSGVWGPALTIIAICVILFVLYGFGERTRAFAANPTMPLSQVQRIVGLKLNYYAEILDIGNGSILAPDIGGALFSSKLKVHDLAGLADKEMASFLRDQRSALEMRNYVLERMKPTFIFVHGFWTKNSGLNMDPRFTEQYVPLVEYPDDYIQTRWNLENVSSGIYVRRDATTGREDALKAIRKDLTYDFLSKRWDF